MPKNQNKCWPCIVVAIIAIIGAFVFAAFWIAVIGTGNAIGRLESRYRTWRVRNVIADTKEGL